MPLYVQETKCFLCNVPCDEKNEDFIKKGRPTEWDECRQCLKMYCDKCKIKPYTTKHIVVPYKKYKKGCDMCKDDDLINKLDEISDLEVLRKIKRDMILLKNYSEKKLTTYNFIIDRLNALMKNKE